MDIAKRTVLQKYREKIVADLEVNHLIDDLYSKLVINSDDREKISSQTERKFRARCLLDILSQKGNEEYNTFVDVLQTDYNWLATDLKKDIGCVSEVEYEEQMYSEALTLGDVPQLPQHYVPRTTELNSVIDKLTNMKRGQYVVLHGMTGSGKSVLAVSAVRNPNLLLKCFNNCMYFVNAGEAKSDMDVATLLYRLYIKLDDSLRTDFNTNVGFDKKGITFMKDRLQKIFSTTSRKEALLILDDVCSANMIEAFNFGCKTLITTQDVSLVPTRNSSFFELNKGFKEAESLQLFSNCVKVRIEDLPLETKKIHDLCKGAPLVIALIASNLEKWKEDAKNKERWNYYINMLIDKKDGRLAKAMQMFFRRKKNEELSKDYLYNTIKHCLSSLPKDYQDYYKHFALFVEDVNITPKVMEIVLRKSKYEVEEIVSELRNKSLIVSAYNIELKSYVYGIHDLLLAHLKQSLSENEIVDLHDKLVRNYLEVSDNNFAKLPNDNYIFTYIGYHLLGAKRYNDFPDLYFDLNFIGAKIKAVGIAGLVGDFVRYRKYITNNENPELKKKLETFESFVQKYGQDLHKYPATDIIQCALQQPLTSEVHEAAVHIAQKQCEDTLYLQTQFFGQTVYVTHTLDLKEDVCATCFAHQTNTILVGTSSGEIHLWDHSYKSKLCTFTGHTNKILYLQLSPDACKFLSVSEDGSVKVWELENACIKSSGQIYDENGFHMHTPPPAIHQKSWMNFFGENVKIDRSKSFAIPDDDLTTASFSADNDYIVVGSRKGVVKTWNLENGEEVFQVTRENSPITCCTFSLKNSVILFSCENIIFVYDFEKKEYLSQFMNDVRTTSLLVVPYSETKIIAISDKSVTIWCWKEREIRRGGVAIFEPESYVLDSREDAHYICGAVTWDGVYLVAGSSDNCINMWNIETREKVKEMVEHNGLVVSLDTFLNKESNSNVMYILLSGADKIVKQWHIREVEKQKNKTSKLLTEFSTSWMHGPIPLIAAVNSEQRVQVFSGHALISESEVMDQPKCLSFSPCGAHVAVGLNNGIVTIFDFRSKKYHSVMDLEGPVKYIEYLKDSRAKAECILVAASDNTCLMAYKDGESVRFKTPETKANIDKGKVSMTIKCFPLLDIQRILSVEENGSIKIWYFNCIENVLVVKEPNSTVTMATITRNRDMIALTFSDRRFRVFEVIIKSGNVSCLYSQGKLLDDIPRSCCFSNDGKLLALGQDSGNIVLWSVENKTQLATLELHKSWVRSVEFSPTALVGAPLVLVSVGDQIVWWNISHVWMKATEHIRRSSRSRRSMRFSQPEELRIDTTVQPGQMDESWVGKKGREGRPELLSAIKLAGVHALDVSISPNFTCFVTVDASGLLYIMNVLRPAAVS